MILPIDQKIRDAGFNFVPFNRFLASPFQIPQDNTVKADPNTGAGIVTLPQRGRDANPFTGGISDLTSGFQTAVDDRQTKLTELNYPYRGGNVFFPGQTGDSIVMEKLAPYGAPEDFYKESIEGVPQTIKGAPGIFDIKPASFGRKIQEGLYSLPFLNKPQSADQIIEEGYTPAIKFGIMANLLPDRFKTLPRGDQAFIQRNVGYTGPTVFGENTTGGAKDPFGLNVTSGFGNYAERVGVESEKLGDLLGGRMTEKYGKGTSGISFNSETGAFEADDETDQAAINAALKATQMNKMNIAKYNYYTAKTKERDADRKAAEEARMRESAANRAEARNITQRLEDDFRRDSGGGFDVSGPDTSSNPTGRSNRASQERGFSLHGADGGRVAYMMGGLADLVDIYD